MVDHLKNNAKYTFTGDIIIELGETSNSDSAQSSFTVKQLLESIPEKYAEAVYLDAVLKISQANIARKLGLGISATKSRIQRGKRMLKELYMQQSGN
jgi:RNA polymerase sigma-70 factor (ECF subfamily)